MLARLAISFVLSILFVFGARLASFTIQKEVFKVQRCQCPFDYDGKRCKGIETNYKILPGYDYSFSCEVNETNSIAHRINKNSNNYSVFSKVQRRANYKQRELDSEIIIFENKSISQKILLSKDIEENSDFKFFCGIREFQNNASVYDDVKSIHPITVQSMPDFQCVINDNITGFPHFKLICHLIDGDKNQWVIEYCIEEYSPKEKCSRFTKCKLENCEIPSYHFSYESYPKFFRIVHGGEPLWTNLVPYCYHQTILKPSQVCSFTACIRYFFIFSISIENSFYVFI